MQISWSIAQGPCEEGASAVGPCGGVPIEDDNGNVLVRVRSRFQAIWQDVVLRRLAADGVRPQEIRRLVTEDTTIIEEEYWTRAEVAWLQAVDDFELREFVLQRDTDVKAWFENRMLRRNVEPQE